LILGSAGQLGTELRRSFAGTAEIVCHDRNALDIGVEEQVRRTIRDVEPDVILNAAAYTAVDRAESEPARAFAINAEAPGVLAEEARRSNALLVHYSTDYVFDGSKTCAWAEDDQPNPLNVYGASKLAGEEAIRRVGGKYLIFRTSWVYGAHGNNFLLTMLKLARERDRLTIVDDQAGAPTTSTELADATRVIVDGVHAMRFGAAENWAGLYHMTCSGMTTWCGFAREIFTRAPELLQGRQPEVVAIKTAEYPRPAKRPLNSILSNQKLYDKFGVRLSPWQTALQNTINELLARRPSE
jgi:dTDP-4-dehydrorhamnose reductase